MTLPVAVTVAEIRQFIAGARGRGLSVGLVATMGALHAGHASLMQAARRETGLVVLSLFVNPAQFGPLEDFERYPRQMDKDLEICTSEGVDVVFAPSRAEMYPSGFRTFVEVSELQDVLCGASRPGHFRGVATVVLKLFHIIQPDLAYFGQKDAQQVRIIQQMVGDLNVPVGIRVCPIVRAPDGLALSSRNQYLSEEQRKQAPVLSQALLEASSRIQAGESDAAAIEKLVASRIAAVQGAVMEYVAVVDAATLQPVQHLQGTILVAVAVKFGGTRLIDNVMVGRNR